MLALRGITQESGCNWSRLEVCGIAGARGRGRLHLGRVLRVRSRLLLRHRLLTHVLARASEESAKQDPGSASIIQRAESMQHVERD